MTTPASPPALPCGTCLHEPVCALKASLGEEPWNAEPVSFAPGLRAIRSVIRVECDHQLTSLRPIEPEPIRAEHGGESWRTPAVDAAVAVNAAERMAQSRRNGNAAMLAKRTALVGRGGNNRKLPVDPVERDSLVLEAVRATTTTGEAGKRLGITATRVQQLLRAMRDEGRLPAEIADALTARRSGRRVVIGEAAAS